MSEDHSEAALPDAQAQAVAHLVREALARRRMSRQRLADEARISISTLEKALSGRRPFTLATVVRLEEALGLSLRTPAAATGPAAPAADLSPASLGAYARTAVSWLEGDYLTLRPSFGGGAGALYAYLTHIAWDVTTSCLHFEERERTDAAFTQSGAVSLPNQSGHIYLVTNVQGQHRMAILGRPTIDGALYGLLTTLMSGAGANLTPVAVPIALLPLARLSEPPVFGRLSEGQPAHAPYAAHLHRIRQEGFAAFLT